jgi:hypothetical protein
MTQSVIGVLNSLLMEEVRAAEAYKQVVQRLPGLDIKAELEELHIAHAKRAQKIKKRLRELAATPIEKTFSRLIMDKVFSGGTEDMASRVLLFFEDIENSVLSCYESSMAELDSLTLSLVQSELLPEQDLTHNVVYTLKTGILQFAKSA